MGEEADSPLLLSPSQLASRQVGVVSISRAARRGWLTGPVALIRSSALLMSPSQLFPGYRSPSSPASPRSPSSEQLPTPTCSRPDDKREFLHLDPKTLPLLDA